MMKVLPIAVSSPFSSDEYEAGKKKLASLDCECVKEAILRKSSPSYLNGLDPERLQELQEALDSNVDLVWAVRGGYGMTRLLPLLQTSTSRSIVVGFSDVTALFAYLWKTQKKKSLHAPVLTKLSLEPFQVLEALKMILTGQAAAVVYPTFTGDSSESIRGILMPANLSILVELIGTPFMPDLTGCILMLEDIGEQPYRLDRMLTHLWASGALSGVVAVIVGHLTDCGENPVQVFRERFQELKMPCFTGFSFGHEVPNWPLPVGVQAEIESSGGVACLKIHEELF